MITAGVHPDREKLPLKILLINKYFYLRGGSERVFFDEAELLTQHGHKVGFFSMEHPRNLPSPFAQYFMPGIDYEQELGLVQKLKEAGRIVYSWEARKRMRRLLEKEKFDVAHLHNIHHQLSPSILDELAAFGIPAVMTLHDYKIVCPTYNLLCQGQVCERCAQGKYYHCLLQRCTKGSYTKSLVNVAEMYLNQSLLGQNGKVACFISPSWFLGKKVQDMGFRGKIVHLRYLIKIKELTPAFDWEDESLVFFGRLSREKGVHTLIEAMAGLPVELKVIGEGPQRQELEKQATAQGLHNVRFLGYLQGQALNEEIRKAMFVVLPSQWYENNPLALLEAFALGKPALGSRIGGVPELIRDYQTGFTFEPGNTRDLNEKIRYLLEHPGLISAMGQKARCFVEEEFNPERHYEGLMEIYRQAVYTRE
jgi:glycosyltransferase involved in cell wall biosynthesis